MADGSQGATGGLTTGDLTTGALAAQVVEVEPLPDGRQLVLFADRRSVVVGVARPRPHPVAGCEWLGAHPRPPRARPRSRPTPQARRPRRVLPDARDSIEPWARVGSRRRPTAEAEHRAEVLLRSLLDPRQLDDWEYDRRFWVQTPRGPVRLGVLYKLLHRPSAQPGWEHTLCVVPDRFQELPIADVWSNLLLVLAVEPEEFFRVAIHQGSRQIPPPRDDRQAGPDELSRARPFE